LPVDAVLVRRRLRALERAVRVLRQLRDQGRLAFVNDEIVQDRVARNAQLAAQACADVALHILAASGRESPETYASALVALAKLGIVPRDLGDRLAAAVRLRNILVHDYLEVDHGRLFDELGWIEDAVTFAARIDAWLATDP
jgi:uncharacterized protein YutE (UPF0331/DUF86 family)